VRARGDGRPIGETQGNLLVVVEDGDAHRPSYICFPL
jgi:hypothetical protein